MVFRITPASFAVLAGFIASSHAAPPDTPLPPSAPGTFTSRVSLRLAVQDYNANTTAAIATYGPVAHWDVSGVSDMEWLFHDMKNFNADISSWNTSGVTNMNNMFRDATAFNQPLSFDTSSVTDMESMFLRASAFNQPLNFDTSGVTNMYGMFGNAAAFNQPLSLDTCSVTESGNMFYGTTSLSDKNKLLTRCASEVSDCNSAFTNGLGWGSESCPPPPEVYTLPTDIDWEVDFQVAQTGGIHFNGADLVHEKANGDRGVGCGWPQKKKCSCMTTEDGGIRMFGQSWPEDELMPYVPVGLAFTCAFTVSRPIDAFFRRLGEKLLDEKLSPAYFGEVTSCRISVDLRLDGFKSVLCQCAGKAGYKWSDCNDEVVADEQGPNFNKTFVLLS